MDYDKTAMPGVYDTGRSHPPDVLEHWLTTIESHIPRGEVTQIVDLGCGTGRFTGHLAELYSAEAVGIDPSAHMLAQARAKTWPPGVRFEQGRAEATSLGDNCCDLVFMSMVFHHITDEAAAAREIGRLCRAKGYLAIRQPSREQICEYVYLPYFPSVEGIAAARLPARQTLIDTFAKAGFTAIARVAVEHQLAPSWAEYVEKLLHRADSFLTSIPDDEFAAGLAQMRREIPQRRDQGAVPSKIDLFVFQATA
jgi:SAM-dependent methyltransferase